METRDYDKLSPERKASLPMELREWFANVDGKDDAAWVLSASAAHIDALTRERDESKRTLFDAQQALLSEGTRHVQEVNALRETLAAKSETQRIDLSTWLAAESDAAKARAEWRERSAETLGVLREIRDKLPERHSSKGVQSWASLASVAEGYLREIRDAVKAKFAWPVQPAPFTPFPQQPWGPGTPVWCGPAGLNTVRGDDGTLVSSGTFSDAQRRAAVVDLVREANSPAAQPEVPPMPEEPEILREMRVQCARPPSSVDVRFDVNVPSAAEIVRYIDALKARTFPASECGGGK